MRQRRVRDHAVEVCIPLVVGEFGEVVDGFGCALRPPPVIGEHNAEILGELGYDAARIADLQEQAII